MTQEEGRDVPEAFERRFSGPPSEAFLAESEASRYMEAVSAVRRGTGNPDMDHRVRLDRIFEASRRELVSLVAQLTPEERVELDVQLGWWRRGKMFPDATTEDWRGIRTIVRGKRRRPRSEDRRTSRIRRRT